MSLDSFKYLGNFNFAEYFGIEGHTIELDNSYWKTHEILANIDNAFRSVRCTYCDDNAVIVNTDEKISFCEKDSKELGLSCKDIAKIDTITNEFKNRVKNIEKYFILVQERIHLIKLDRFKALIGKQIEDIDDSYNNLIYKINSFHTIIKNLKKTRSHSLLFEAKTSFDNIKQTT